MRALALLPWLLAAALAQVQVAATTPILADLVRQVGGNRVAAVAGVVLVLFFGVTAFLMEENGFPVAPAILGVVLGTMMEENFVTSMIKSDGDPWVFFSRPIAMWLAAGTLLILFWPVLSWGWQKIRGHHRPAL